MSTHCPHSEQLTRLLDEAHTETERLALESHIEGCPVCQAQLQRLLMSRLRREVGEVVEKRAK